MVEMLRMMIKCHTMRKADSTYEWTLLVCLIFTLNVDSFKLKCPSQANWKFRAKVKCNSTMKYFCLYNNVERKYVEGCNGPDWDRKGSKRIFAGYFTREQCLQERFQPIKFWTNESMSDCLYAKSICSEEGQLMLKEDSTKDDIKCRCDYENSYSYIKTPRNLCSCLPTQEDCSCHIKTCAANYSLSSDYECIQSDNLEKLKCKDERYYVAVDDTIRVLIERNKTWISGPNFKLKFKWRTTAKVTILISICFILVAGGFVVGVIYQILQPLPTYIQIDGRDNDDNNVLLNEMVNVAQINHEPSTRTPDDKGQTQRLLLDDIVVTKTEIAVDFSTIDGCNTESGESTAGDQTHDNGCFATRKERVNVDVLIPLQSAERTPDEVNFLRLLHLLFRVAGPVVRMIFNREIQPNQLRKLLDKNKAKLEKQCRKKEKIDSYQWDLLYKNVKEKTSEDFDISLMINLLRTLVQNIKVGDLYPVRTDISIGAMLSRILYIRNEATQSFEGGFTDTQFKQYWYDSGQAILKLVSSHLGNIEYDTKMTKLIGRLHELNPMDIDYNKLCLFIDMSEKFPSIILQQIISEYCTKNKQVIEDVLKEEKHDLFHKRIKAEPCCECATEYSTYIKVIHERQWEALFEAKEGNSFSCLHTCTSEVKKCYERFVPKRIATSDLLVSMPLILNIPSILKYVISRLCVSGFSKFLLQNQHTLYHSMEKIRCCKCINDPIEKILFNKKEWNKLFKKADSISCKGDTKDCCCYFSVRDGIDYASMDDTLLSKLFYVAGPISILNKIGQDSFLYFLSWTVDGKPLQNAITELLQIIEDKKCIPGILQHLSSGNFSNLDKTITQEADASDWLYRHLRNQKETTEPPLHIISRDKDGLNVKSIQTPIDFRLPRRAQKFTDITNEENHFLVVIYGLTKIVYPVIKNHFSRKCPTSVLDKICTGIYENDCNDLKNRENKGQQKRKLLTKKQREQLFSPKLDSGKMDLTLMILLLKQRPEDDGKKEDDCQLDVIDRISREIIQSSSGILNEIKFKEIMEHITKAVLHLGGALYNKELVNLHHIKNILE